MLAKEAPDGGWLHELKYDGYRIGCLIVREAVKLISRRGNDWTAQCPEIAAAARTLKVSDALRERRTHCGVPGRLLETYEDGARRGRAIGRGSVRAKSRA